MDGGSSSVSTLCSRCQNFYGSDATLGMCSACFREHQKANASSGPQGPPVVSSPQQGVEATAAAVAAVAAATSSQPEQQQQAATTGAAETATATATATTAPAELEVTEAKAENAKEAAAAMPSNDTAAVAAAPPAVPAEAAAPASASAAAAAPPSDDRPPVRAPQPPGRCMACRKKVSLAARFSCRCGYEFCSSHRLAEDHECSFDWKGLGREALAKANPLVQASKVDKI